MNDYLLVPNEDSSKEDREAFLKNCEFQFYTGKPIDNIDLATNFEKKYSISGLLKNLSNYKEIDDLLVKWPQIGFLDNGSIVISNQNLLYWGTVYQNYKTKKFICHIGFYGKFEFINKKDLVYGQFSISELESELELRKTSFGKLATLMAQSDFFTSVWDIDKVECPEKQCSFAKHKSFFHYVVEHLNDAHLYTFDQLSQWLGTLKAKPKVLPVTSTNNKYFGEIFEDYRKFNSRSNSAEGDVFCKKYEPFQSYANWFSEPNTGL